MKRFLFLFLAVALILTAFPVSGTTAAEPVTALETGYQNVLFSNGYRGFCLDRDLHGADSGDSFTTADTSGAASNYDSRLIAQDLKILFTQSFESLFTADGNGNYSISNTNTVQAVIWHLTENQYVWGEQKTLVQSIAAYTGPEIPDHGYQRTLDNGDIITFDFMIIKSERSDVQDFFAYKISVNQEPPHEHTPGADWEHDATRHWKECECGTEIDNTRETHTSDKPENKPGCEKQAVCDTCGEAYGEIPSHSFTKEEIKPSALKAAGDCGQEAVYIKSCEHCGLVDPNTENTFPGEKDAHNHADYGTYPDDVVTPDHKNQVNGYTGDEKCNSCNEILNYGQSIPAGPHEPADNWSGDDTHHWKDCAVPGCDEEIAGSKEPHVSNKPENKPGCEKQAVCDTCGEAYGEIPQHEYGNEIPKDPAEIGKDGVKAHYQCSECWKYFVSTGSQMQEVTYDELRIPALLPPPPTPTEPTVAPTEPSVAPTEPGITPTEPAVTPTEPSVAPTEPSVAPTEPGVAPTEPGITPTEPTVTPTEPSVAPTEPTVAPTEPTIPPDDSDSTPPDTGNTFRFPLCILICLLCALGCFALLLTQKKTNRRIQ